MENFEKHTNTFKSAIGQIDRLIEDSTETESVEELLEAKQLLESAYNREIKSLLTGMRRAMRKIAQAYSDVFGQIANSLKENDNG